MRDDFKAFYLPTEEEFTELWSHAVIVVDANVLLNLYRYPDLARKDLLGAFEHVSERLWIPFYAALEFQRNRLGVIADQKRRFREVTEIIDAQIKGMRASFEQLQLKKRHSKIDVDEFLENLDSIVEKFKAKLVKLCSEHEDVRDPDKLRNHIDSLFEGRVGPAPESQAFLNDLFKEADDRFKRGMPPGFNDSKKSKEKQSDEVQYSGLVFKRSVGDFLIWKQIITHSKSSQIKHLIFVTDDEKNDWWWSADSGGKQTIGPRPELTEEIVREAGVESFFMYNSETFLYWANKLLKIEVHNNSISQVREVRRALQIPSGGIAYPQATAEIGVMNWISSLYPDRDIITESNSNIDFCINSFGTTHGRVGFEVKFVSDEYSMNHLSAFVHRAILSSQGYSNDGLRKTIIVFASPSERIAEFISPLACEHRFLSADSLAIIVGVLEIPLLGPVFRPLFGTEKALEDVD